MVNIKNQLILNYIIIFLNQVDFYVHICLLIHSKEDLLTQACLCTLLMSILLKMCKRNFFAFLLQGQKRIFFNI